MKNNMTYLIGLPVTWPIQTRCFLAKPNPITMKEELLLHSDMSLLRSNQFKSFKVEKRLATLQFEFIVLINQISKPKLGN